MDTKGFNINEISEHNKEALQSDTWQTVRNSNKTEIQHFTIEIFKDNPYGYPWSHVVEEYLKNGYKEKNNEHELTVLGNRYKVLKREYVTVFYDTDGNTLFDVENRRLEMEYDDEEPEEQSGSYLYDNGTVRIDKNDIKQMAKEKLEAELEADKDKSFAEPVIGFLLRRCEEDAGLAQDVMQEHKTWGKCFDYIFKQAKKQAKGNKAAVRDDVVYEWAEDYYHKDDKAEEEKKAKEAAERKKKAEERKKKVDEQKKADKKNLKQAAKRERNAEGKPAEPPKPKKNPKEMDGQMDLFSMMGM